MTDTAAPQTPGPWHCSTLPGHFDEVMGGGDANRPAWQRLFDGLDQLGEDELSRRWEQGRRLIRENGVTYNVYNDPGGLSRPWQLDAVPVVIDAADWAEVEAAVAQRAKLIDLTLGDLYGRQDLLKQGAYPAELIYAGEQYLRAVHNVPCPKNVRLHVYAADLARSPTGKWWVVNDRTQGPSGAGYALENRIVMTRTLPDVFRDLSVTRLAEFFSHLRTLLRSLAPPHRERPRIVLLTPGPYNETYFEHAYLARYLGYPLVEPNDLTVRNATVYLKTLDGLMPVDVIFRRMDDNFCDPLELREDSLLGVPGLVEAARTGRVAVANSLGSGATETPALMAFLPALARTLLGQELLMPSVATWWCGQAAPRKYVLDHLDDLVIKPTFPKYPIEPVFVGDLSADEREELRAQITRSPNLFVAQERVRLSTAPTWVGNGMQPRHMMLRVFAVADGEGGYHVMPGGLARVSGSTDSTSVDVQSGGGSKDTWVLGDRLTSTLSLLPQAGQAATVSRQGFVLPSRVADNLYWLGRYAERIDGAIRVIRCALERMTDESDLNDVDDLPWLIDVLVDEGRLSASIDRDEVDQAVDSLGPTLLDVLFDGESPGSVRSDVQKIYRLGSMVRDRIAVDAWRILSRLEEQFVMPAVSEAVRVNTSLDYLDDAVLTLTAFTGQTVDGMTHEKGWRFLDMGRRIERSHHLLQLLQCAMGHSDKADSQRMQSMLEIANNAMTYRSRYQMSVQAVPVLDLLLLDESNPRSLAHQVAGLAEHIDALEGADPKIRRSDEQRIVLRTLTSIRLLDVETVGEHNARMQRVALVRLVTRLRGELNELSTALTTRYLSHARPARQISDMGPERPA